MATGTKGGVGIRLFIAGADVVKRGFNDVADSGKKMWAEIALGEKAANPAVVALSRASGEAQGVVKGMAGEVGRLSPVLGAFGAAGVGVAAALGGLVLAMGKAREAMDFADKLQVQADTLGITTDALQEYQYALRITGGDAEKAGTAIADFREKFGAARAQLTAKAVAPFKALGMAPEDLKQFDTIEAALAAVIDKIAALSDESEQAAIAEKLGLSDMLPLIREGEGAFGRLAAEAHSLGVVMDRDLIKRAAETKDEFDTVSQVVDIQLKQAFVDLGPVLVSIMGLVADLATALADLADSWRDLDTKSTGGLKRQVNRLEAEKYSTFQQFQTYKARPDADPNVLKAYVISMNNLDRQIGEMRGELSSRDTAPRGATGNGNLKPQVKPAGGGRGARAGRDSFTGQLPAETLAAIADGRLTEAEARQMLAAVPDDARVVIVNTVEATTAEAQRKKIAAETSIADLAMAAPDQNARLTGGLPDLVRGPFGGLMSPEDKEAWARDIGDATAQGLDAALHGDFTEFLRQKLYSAALDGLSNAVTDALKGADFGGGGGGGGFWSTVLSAGASLFGGGRAGGGGVGSGMWVNAGEHGRTELAMIGGNGYVADHEATKRMIGEAVGGHASGARAPQTVTIISKLEIPPGYVSDRALAGLLEMSHRRAVAEAVQTSARAAPDQAIQYQFERG